MSQLPNSDKFGNEFSFKCIKIQSESNMGREEFDYFLPFDNQQYENESQISNRSFSMIKSGNQILAIESPIHKVEEQEDMDDDQFLSQNQISYFTVPGKVMHESIIDQSYRSQFLPKTIEDLSNDKGQRKIRKQGCTCKKRKCSSKYCWCIKNGMTCSDLCKCQNCINTKEQVRKASTSTERKGCKCKKNNCLKGYCDCFVNGQKCNSNCKCLQCKNILQKQNDSLENKEKTVPKIKKRIKKFSLLYRKGRGFRRTNRKKILID